MSIFVFKQVGYNLSVNIEDFLHQFKKDAQHTWQLLREIENDLNINS